MFLSKQEQSNIEKININFINELNLDSDNPLSLLFEDIKDHFETIVLKYLDLFLEQFKNVYFYYENLLYLLIDYNIFKLLGIDTSLIHFTLNIDEIINGEGINQKKCLICDYDLKNLYYYHILGFFNIYLLYLSKMCLLINLDHDSINSIN